MIYQEMPVPAELQQYIICFWKFVGPDQIAGRSIQHYIMPDASSSLIFFQHPPSQYRGTCLAGPTKYIREMEVFADSLTVGVRFKPGLTSSIFQLSGLQLRDENLRPAPPLPALDAGMILDCLPDEAQLWPRLQKQLQNIFQALSPDQHPAVNHAITLILESKGNLKIADLLHAIPLSERQLQKIFKREVGLTLKEFATVMRLRDAIIQLELEQKDYQDMVFDSGYYDQAHFIRDFSKLSRISLPAFKQYIKNIRHIGVTSKQ